MTKPDSGTDGISLKDQILLEKCRDIELLSRDLYYVFAETYADSAEADSLWRKTAREEQNHADQFTLALKLRSGLHLRTGISLEKADSLIQKLQNTLAKVVHTPLTLLEALAFAVKLERFLAGLHLACMAEFSDESFSRLFNAMMSSDQDHIASIEALQRKLLDATNATPDPAGEQKPYSVPGDQEAASSLESYQHRILDLFKEQELLMASLYQRLVTLFPAHADSYTAFVAEEMEHAGWIEQLHSACLSGKARFTEGKTRSYTVSGMISYMQKFLKELEAGQLTELQAVTAMAGFENALIERNVFQRFSGDSPDVEKVLSALEYAQKIHTGSISTVLQQLRVSHSNS